MSLFSHGAKKSKIELIRSSKGKICPPVSVFKSFFLIFAVSVFWFPANVFAVVHSGSNIAEKNDGDFLLSSELNTILKTISGIFFDDETGNVGIGITDPNESWKLTVLQPENSYGLVVQDPNGKSTIGFAGEPVFKRIWTEANGLNLGTHGGGTLDESKLHINDSGNVGIGTTSPKAKLQVNGQILMKKMTLVHYNNYPQNNNKDSLALVDFFDETHLIDASCASGWCCSNDEYKSICLSSGGQINISLQSSKSISCTLLSSDDDHPNRNINLLFATDGGNDCYNSSIGRPANSFGHALGGCAMVEKNGKTSGSPIDLWAGYAIACF